MNDWKEYILEDVIEKFIDYRGKTPKKTEDGIPLDIPLPKPMSGEVRVAI
jgi:hypothetical protein